MRIAIVLDRCDPQLGGLEQWTSQLVTWLLTAGHEVHVVAFAFAPDLLPLGIITHLLTQPRSRLKREAAAETCLKTLSPDVIHDMGTGWFFDVLHPGFGSRIVGYRQDLLSLPPLQRLRDGLSLLYVVVAISNCERWSDDNIRRTGGSSFPSPVWCKPIYKLCMGLSRHE